MLRADWVTLNPIDYTLRVFVSKEDAFISSVRLNERSDDHPAFLLYRIVGTEIKLKFIGELHRDFGDDKFYWKK